MSYKTLKLNKIIGILFFSLGMITFAQESQGIRLKDLTVVAGMKEKQILGIGLVTGLNGKGDSADNMLLKNTLARLITTVGIDVKEQDLVSKNVAVVSVTANIPAFARVGEKIDVYVSSIGDAKGLEGGFLITTPLQDNNKEIFAHAQGLISLEKNSPVATTTRVFEGAIIDKEVVSNFMQSEGMLSFLLKKPDFTTAELIGKMIQSSIKGAQVKVLDSGRIDVSITADYKDNPVGLIAEIEKLRIRPDYRAKVVINSKSGIIVLGEHVAIGSVAISVSGLKVKIEGNRRDTTEQFAMASTTTVGDLVSSLEGVGISTSLLIEVLKALEKAGALYGELEII